MSNDVRRIYLSTASDWRPLSLPRPLSRTHVFTLRSSGVAIATNAIARSSPKVLYAQARTERMNLTAAIPFDEMRILLMGLHPPSDMTYFSTASDCCDLRFGDPPGPAMPPLLSPPLPLLLELRTNRRHRTVYRSMPGCSPRAVRQFLRKGYGAHARMDCSDARGAGHHGRQRMPPRRWARTRTLTSESTRPSSFSAAPQSRGALLARPWPRAPARPAAPSRNLLQSFQIRPPRIRLLSPAHQHERTCDRSPHIIKPAS